MVLTLRLWMPSITSGLTWLLCMYDPATVLIGWVRVWIAWRCNLPTHIISWYSGSTCWKSTSNQWGNKWNEPWQIPKTKTALTFWELGTEAFAVLTVIWPETNIDDVPCGRNGRRPGDSTKFTQEWRRLVVTIMDLEIRSLSINWFKLWCIGLLHHKFTNVSTVSIKLVVCTQKGQLLTAT